MKSRNKATKGNQTRCCYKTCLFQLSKRCYRLPHLLYKYNLAYQTATSNFLSVWCPEQTHLIIIMSLAIFCRLVSIFHRSRLTLKSALLSMPIQRELSMGLGWKVQPMVVARGHSSVDVALASTGTTTVSAAFVAQLGVASLKRVGLRHKIT